MIKYKNKWIHPKKCNLFKKINLEKICYFHIELENYEKDNLVINGGLIVESLGNGSLKDRQIWKTRSENRITINNKINTDT